MRSLDETKSRWEATVTTRESIGELRRSIKFDGSTNPCQSGCRSACWKAFLLFRDEPTTNWSNILRESRDSYSLICAEHLRFIKHPEQLTALPIDPLADDPDSPWDALRNDELVRAEILQDVRRLPDEPFYHQENVQTMILDILFLYCKLNPSVGGYRQGMHELLAPIVYVVAQDAIDRNAIAVGDAVDPAMVDMLDSYFIEHDAYTLFSKVMGRAATFYEVGSGSGSTVPERNTIVEKSKYIHEVALMKIDPELATHLSNIEVLPQIFLIRWVRLLFSREFPFEDLLAFWDALFSFDPDLELIDLICVSMLLRVRWTLLEADYSVALQLLLKYPAPQPPHGPHTFVDDALYLRNHSNTAGGVTIIFKYTGKSPATVPTPAPSTRPLTPSFQGFGSLRQRTLGARSPLTSSKRLLQQQSVEALLQGAAKGMIERGEKLGINQAVRDAMGEIRRNMQGLQESRSPGRKSRGTGSDHSQALDLEFMERRNQQLAAMLDESINALKQLTASGSSDKEGHNQMIDLAAARIQFVKICLEDSSISLPEEDMPPIGKLSISSQEVHSPTVALDTTPVVMTSSAVEETRASLSRGPSPVSKELDGVLPPVQEESSQAVQGAEEEEVPDKMETDISEPAPSLPKPDPPAEDSGSNPVPVSSPPPPTTTTTSSTAAKPNTPPKAASPSAQERPPGPIPTRSTLAQSSFSWMLEPDVTPVSAPLRGLSSPSSSSTNNNFRAPTSPPSKKRAGNSSINPARERNAFLFGEVTSDPLTHGGDSAERKLSADEIFGLQPLRKPG